MSMPPDEEQRHDDFLRLFAVSEPALRAFVRSLVPRREDVPDVMQEVVVVLWRKFGELAAPEDFRKWAFGVARLETLAWARDKARDRHVFDAELLATLADAAERSSRRLGGQREALDIAWASSPSRGGNWFCRPTPRHEHPANGDPTRADPHGAIQVAPPHPVGFDGMHSPGVGAGAVHVNQDRRASEFVQRYVDGVASADETRQLAELLRTDAEFREQFLEYLNIDLALEDIAAAGEAHQATTVEVDRGIPRRRWRGGLGLAAAIALMVTAMIWSVRNRSSSGIDRPSSSFVAAEVLAADGVHWVGLGPPLDAGTRFKVEPHTDCPRQIDAPIGVGRGARSAGTRRHELRNSLAIAFGQGTAQRRRGDGRPRIHRGHGRRRGGRSRHAIRGGCLRRGRNEDGCLFRPSQNRSG